MNKEIFGERLKLIRLEKRLSLEELGNIIGVSKTTLSKYERAMREPKITIINDLAEYFEVPVEWLIGYDENKSTNITSIYNELEPTRQQKVYNFAEHELKEQKSSIKKQVSDLDSYRNRKKEIQTWEDIRFGGAISAGTGEFLDGATEDYISLPENIVPHSADFCLIVNGDSMEPVILNGSYVFIDETNEIPSGSISAVTVNGEAFIKRVWFENGHARLESFNDQYEDIIVTKEDDFHIIGKVVM